MKVYLDRDVVKFINNLSSKEKERILRRLKALEVDPFLGKKLKDRENTYSIRVGKYRIIYEIHPEIDEIWVLKIDKRSRVYDRLD